MMLQVWSRVMPARMDEHDEILEVFMKKNHRVMWVRRMTETWVSRITVHFWLGQQEKQKSYSPRESKP